jgi:hypothetical protein
MSNLRPDHIFLAYGTDRLFSLADATAAVAVCFAESAAASTHSMIILTMLNQTLQQRKGDTRELSLQTNGLRCDWAASAACSAVSVLPNGNVAALLEWHRYATRRSRMKWTVGVFTPAGEMLWAAAPKAPCGAQLTDVVDVAASCRRGDDSVLHISDRGAAHPSIVSVNGDTGEETERVQPTFGAVTPGMSIDAVALVRSSGVHYRKRCDVAPLPTRQDSASDHEFPIDFAQTTSADAVALLWASGDVALHSPVTGEWLRAVAALHGASRICFTGARELAAVVAGNIAFSDFAGGTAETWAPEDTAMAAADCCDCPDVGALLIGVRWATPGGASFQVGLARRSHVSSVPPLFVLRRV